MLEGSQSCYRASSILKGVKVFSVCVWVQHHFGGIGEFRFYIYVRFQWINDSRFKQFLSLQCRLCYVPIYIFVRTCQTYRCRSSMLEKRT